MADLYEIDFYNSDEPVPDEHESVFGITQKLELAERANAIYREQLKWMQAHLASLRRIISEKEDIIENLMLRYETATSGVDNVVIPTTIRENWNNTDELTANLSINTKYQKIWCLAQVTALQNHELRDRIYELHDALYQNMLEQPVHVTVNDDNTTVDRPSDAHHLNELDSLIETLDVHEQMKKQEVRYYTDEINQLKKELAELKFALRINDYDDAKTHLKVDHEFQTNTNELLERHLPLMDHNVTVEWNRQEQLNLERLRYRSIFNEYDEMKIELRQWSVVQNNWNIIKEIFGYSIKSLIPFQLNDVVLDKYLRLFDGYVRAILEDNAVDCAIIPREITQLISWFYPIFWMLK
eukprot:93435_1